MTTPETDTTKRRRVMRSFRIDEISAVDRPAQAGATARLMKRAAEGDQATTPDPDPRRRRRRARPLWVDETGAAETDATDAVKRAALPDATVDRDHCEHRDRAALQAEQTACDGTLAAAALGIELPADLADAPEVDTVLDPDASPEEVAAYRERARRYRDRVEREARLRSLGTSARTLLDLDLALEARAAELRREGETMEGAFTRLTRGGDETFDALVAERERVGEQGP